MTTLTKRQKQILDHIQGFIAEHHYAPSLTEIAKHFGLSSPATVHEHLKGLEEKGYIQRGWNRKRSLTLLDPKAQEPAVEESIEVPLLGQIAAGEPIEAILDEETVAVPNAMIRPGRRHYALKVRGSSMIDDHILDGDLVIIQTTATAENGQTVVALVDGAAATLKRYYREGPQIRLQPANEEMAPIYINEENLNVQGVVVGLMRAFG
jgi:repressor LexA